MIVIYTDLNHVANQIGPKTGVHIFLAWEMFVIGI